MTTTDLFLEAWRFDPVVVLGCAAAIAVYATSPHAKSASRLAFLSAATLILAVALVSPVGALADGYLFSAHMLQHLLVLLVVPPLALLGVSHSPRVSDLTPLPAGRGDGEARRRAALGWLAGVSAMWLWHAPRLCDAATRSGWIHLVQELSLVGMGLAFWWPILAPREESRLAPLAGVVYLFTACTACMPVRASGSRSSGTYPGATIG